MANNVCAGIGCVLGLLLSATAMADEGEQQPAMDFLEFLGEGQNIDGEYHDPMQMQDWQQSELAEGQGQQEEEKSE